MPEPKDTTINEAYKGFSNIKCPFFPCHKNVKREFNCLFCCCPLYWIECPGPYKLYLDRRKKYRKDCTDCKLPHDGFDASWNFIQKWLEDPKPWVAPEYNS